MEHPLQNRISLVS